MNGRAAEKLDGHRTVPVKKIRLRFINGINVTISISRIPGLKMTVVAADGQYVNPVAG